MDVKSSNIFAKCYNKIFREILDHVYERWTFTGGRSSTKSSFISLVIIILIMNIPGLNALVVRQTAKSLRRSVWEQIVWAINTLHAPLYTKKKGYGWKIPNSETAALPIVYYRKSGKKQTVFFAGCDDPEKIKSIKIADGYLGILWIEEKTEFNEKDISNVKVSAMRGGDRYWIFESFNPPASKRHWCNREKRQNDEHRHVVHNSYLDIPKEWLSDVVVHEIEQMKANNPNAYKNIFLGEETGTGQYIFENIEIRPITDQEINSYEWNYYGVDFGYYPDPFIWVAMSYDIQKEIIYIYDEVKLYKHGNYEASEALKEHGVDITQRTTADSAEPKSVADFREYGWNMRGAVKGKGSLDAGFKWLQSRTKIVIDGERCPESADEFSLYEHDIDKKTGEIISGYPQGQPDHSMAAVRYALEQVWMKRGN